MKTLQLLLGRLDREVSQRICGDVADEQMQHFLQATTQAQEALTIIQQLADAVPPMALLTTDQWIGMQNAHQQLVQQFSNLQELMMRNQIAQNAVDAEINQQQDETRQESCSARSSHDARQSCRASSHGEKHQPQRTRSDGTSSANPRYDFAQMIQVAENSRVAEHYSAFDKCSDGMISSPTHDAKHSTTAHSFLVGSSSAEENQRQQENSNDTCFADTSSDSRQPVELYRFADLAGAENNRPQEESRREEEFEHLSIDTGSIVDASNGGVTLQQIDQLMLQQPVQQPPDVDVRQQGQQQQIIVRIKPSRTCDDKQQLEEAQIYSSATQNRTPFRQQQSESNSDAEKLQPLVESQPTSSFIHLTRSQAQAQAQPQRRVPKETPKLIRPRRRVNKHAEMEAAVDMMMEQFSTILRAQHQAQTDARAERVQSNPSTSSSLSSTSGTMTTMSVLRPYLASPPKPKSPETERLSSNPVVPSSSPRQQPVLELPDKKSKKRTKKDRRAIEEFEAEIWNGPLPSPFSQLKGFDSGPSSSNGEGTDTTTTASEDTTTEPPSTTTSTTSDAPCGDGNPPTSFQRKNSDYEEAQEHIPMVRQSSVTPSKAEFHIRQTLEMTKLEEEAEQMRQERLNTRTAKQGAASRVAPESTCEPEPETSATIRVSFESGRTSANDDEVDPELLARFAEVLRRKSPDPSWKRRS